MSSILDAVTKDASRSGTIPGEAGSPAPAGRGGSGPGRFRSAALVVVFGVAMGALAARMFGGGEGAPDDMLTEKSTGRSAPEAAPVAAGEAPAAARPRKKELAGARQAAGDKPAVVAAVPATPPPPAPLVIPAPAPAPAPASPPPPSAAAPAKPAAPAAVATAPAPAPPVAAAPTPAAPAPPPVAAAPPPAVASAPPPVASAPKPPAVPSPPAVVASQPPAPTEPLPAAVATAPAVVAGATPTTTLVPGENFAAPDDPGALDPPPAPPAAGEVVLEERPSGAPEVSILFVAWSKKPANRMASMRVGSGSLSVVHEGEYVEGLQVTGIHPESVVFRWTGQKFRVPVRPF